MKLATIVAFFRQIFDEVLKEFTNLRADQTDLVTTDLNMVRKFMLGGRRHSEPSAVAVDKVVLAAVDEAFAAGLNSIEFGGDDGTVATSPTIESMAEVIDLETLG